MAFPAWLAFRVQVPAATSVTVRESAPERVQVDGVADEYEMERPEVVVSEAESVKVPEPKARLLNGLKVMV